ncbi:protein MIZU-KUSSEI 1-like [Magnolia sinica]|uniref:protein MIZU-KUSSEI 1-like n=1 Tax=Magnolia sinica TaxID=86752 RepID=UPI00265A180D|nr:protein MIZU-KUSSEI 1-like [Magnolia sinica]
MAESIDSEKQNLTWWNLIRPIASLVLPCWACEPYLSFDSAPHNPIVIGTIICPHNEKVRLCLQQDSRSFPSLLLDLPLHTCEFAAEIDRGTSMIALQCGRGTRGPLLAAPAWAVYCNGRKVGYATRQPVTENDTWLLETMRTVSAGAGFVPRRASDSGGFKYVRGRFEKVVGSADCESYHLIDPSGCMGHQELSLFFMRL